VNSTRLPGADKSTDHLDDPDAARLLPSAGTPSGDRQLVRAASLGDAAAWDRIVAHYAQPVWELARSSELRYSEAAAVSELVWLRLAQALPDLGEPLGVWLRTATRRESGQALQRVRPHAGGRDRRRQSRRSG
jgi:hypothetical protein